MKTRFPILALLTLACGCALSPWTHAQETPAQVTFPPGIDWSNATPDQIADAVFNAVKNNPDAAPQIAVSGLESAAQTGRWVRTASQDGKQTLEPDGSSEDPGIDEIASVISDAAKRGNPAMAPQIDSAMSSALGSLPPPGSSGGSTGGETGGGGSGGGVAPPPIFGGGGGSSGGDSTQTPASDPGP